MTSRLHWLLLQITRQLWFRAALFSVLAIATALVAVVLAPYIPDNVSTSIGAQAVDKILGVLATSMLAVAIFSLSTMVSAYIAATSTVTPRAFRLLIEDGFTQNALSTFVGSFLFSLVGLIALSTGLYDVRGRLVLFVVTLGLIVFIVLTLLRWIDHVSKLGQVAETADRIEDAACEAMRQRHRRPFLGGQPLNDRSIIPADATSVYAQRIGYVQHVDVGALSELAGTHEGSAVYIGCQPGSFVDPARPVAWISGIPSDDATLESVRTAFTVADLRTFDQDPRFGLVVLSEIASRALSMAINDPGTAIDVIGRAVRVLSTWAQPPPVGDDPHKVHYPNVHVPPIGLEALFDDAFRPIARDGAGMIEIGIRLQKAFRALAMLDDPRYLAPAQLHSRLALERALPALTIDHDRERLRELAAEIAAIKPKR